MALAGWCAQCGAWTWVRGDGSCANGHAPSGVSNVYEAGEPAAAAPAASTAPGARPRDIVYDESLDVVLVSGSDLAAAIASSGITPGALAPSLGFAPAHDAAGRLAALDGRGAEILDHAVAMLADPARSAYVQFAVADESVGRLVLAWDQAMERVAVVARRGDEATLALRSPEEVHALLAGAIGLDGALEPLDVRLAVGATEAIVFVAVADTLRRARLDSLLTHTSPPGSFTAEQVTATLVAADAEDFRWALQMLDKVAPFRASALPSTTSVARALGELVKVGLLTITPADASSVALYGLDDAGVAACDAWTHEIGRLAITVSGARVGAVVRETLVLVRDARRLWLVDIADSGGAISCLGVNEAERLLGNLAGSQLPDNG